MTGPTLKPCPFCGSGRVALRTEISTAPVRDLIVCVHCRDCGGSGEQVSADFHVLASMNPESTDPESVITGIRSTAEAATESWNLRAGKSSENVAIRHALEHIRDQLVLVVEHAAPGMAGVHAMEAITQMDHLDHLVERLDIRNEK